MNKYKGKYRIESNRLQNWDYGWLSYYFVTIVCKNRLHYFGEIQNNKMSPSPIAKHAIQEWLNTPNIRPDMNLTIDEFCIMPNHFHAIIFIGKNKYNKPKTTPTPNNVNRRDVMHHVSTTPTNNDKNNKFRPARKNLSSIVRGFKSSVTTYARKNDIEFSWQPNYHDRIIRNEAELFKIRQYIQNNPNNWQNNNLRFVLKLKK